MLLGQISYLDCSAFLAFLAPQLLLQAGLVDTIKCAFQTLPFILFRMPYELVVERYLTKKTAQTPFIQRATLFQDIVIRCVRFAFARIPATIGKVFFSKQVALPFLKFRQLRHGYLKPPVHWEELNEPGLKGIWIVDDPYHDVDILIYYCHGGGFSMGSSFFYLEFLMAWVSILRQAGYRNPGVFAQEYTLVPHASFPTQLHESQAGYAYAQTLIRDPSQIVVAGDSAGGALILSLLLSLTAKDAEGTSMPGMAVLISPWTTIISSENRNTKSDYLDAEALELYGRQYLGTRDVDDPVASPGSCHDLEWWKRASPEKGWLFAYGAEEVFAPEVKRLVRMLSKADTHVEEREEPGWIHAWPVVQLFLGDTRTERQAGLRTMVEAIKARMPPEPDAKSYAEWRELERERLGKTH